MSELPKSAPVPRWYEVETASKSRTRRYTHKPCSVCGNFLTPHGAPCPSCQEGMEYDRLEREVGR